MMFPTVAFLKILIGKMKVKWGWNIGDKKKQMTMQVFLYIEHQILWKKIIRIDIMVRNGDLPRPGGEPGSSESDRAGDSPEKRVTGPGPGYPTRPNRDI